MTASVDVADTVTRCAELVRDRYLFADVGAQVATLLEHRLASGAYADATSPSALGELVTPDLQSVNGDLHLRLKYHLNPLPDLADPAAERASYAVMARDDLNGVRRVERLTGNVALLGIADLLYPAELVGAALAAAMTLVADATALILDLRHTRGGDPGAVALVCSYLFDEPEHLNDLVPRDAAETTQSWTLPWVPGPRFGATKPLWVLTSERTFSAGEELAFDLQQTQRGTVIGETTGGGAHAREGFDVHPLLELTVPVVAARNPVSRTNWEGTGVVPDIAVPAADALSTAHRLALQHLAQDETLSPTLRREIAAARR